MLMADTSSRCEPAVTPGMLNFPSPRTQPKRVMLPLVLRISLTFAAMTSSPAHQQLMEAVNRR